MPKWNNLEGEMDFTSKDLSKMQHLLWWLKGYFDGVTSAKATCAFDEDHLKTIDKAGATLEKMLPENNDQK